MFFFFAIRKGVGTPKHKCLCILFNMLTSLYIFLRPEDGPMWPKHVVSILNRIQRRLWFDVHTPFLISSGKGHATDTCILCNSGKILSVVAKLAMPRVCLLDYPCPPLIHD